ncbi:hypothetical protein BC332_01955 [Capsicum chinense]|nr:hypothetical protein BC332_01955 [Capsicum chinense]
MTLEVKGSSSSGILIYANETSLSFTPRKFAIITRLNCVSNRYDFIFYEGVPKRMIEKYFNGTEIIQKRQLFLAFAEKVWGENSDEDAKKFTILYFLHSFVLYNIATVVIPCLHFDLVDSGRYKDFSWGSLSFEDLARSLNNRLKAGGKFYLIQEMPLAIQVYLYECCSNVPPKIALKVDNRNPPLLNWKTTAPCPRYEFLMNAMFKDNGKVVFKNIEPTEMKLAKLEIPQKDVTEDERSVDSDDNFQDPPPKIINERSKKKQEVQSKADSHVEEVAVLKLESHVEKETFIFKKVFDAFREEQQHEDTNVEAQQMNYVGVETSPQQFSPTVDQNLDENQDGTKGCTDLHPDKTNIEIDSQHLIPDELLQSINLDYNLSEKIVHHDVRITDEKLDDTNLSDSQLTILDKLLPSLNAYQRESITRHSLTTCEEEQSDEHFNDKKFESVVQDHCQENKENVGSSSKTDMHGEVDLGMEEQIMTTPKIQELTTDEQRDETVWLDSQDTILDNLLLSLNVYNSKSIIVHPSANRKLQTPIPKLRIRRSSKFNESPYTMKFGSAVAQHIDVCFYYLRKKSKYDPNRSYKFSTVDCNFMNIIRSVHEVYYVDAANLTVGEWVAHLNEYINGFRMHAAVLWNTVEDTYISVNIKEKHHWVLAILSFSERCIFLYDSYESSGHYPSVLNVIEKLAAIIPLCLQQCDFYIKKGIDVENHPRYKNKDSSDMFDVLFQENCGVYMAIYAECLSYGHKVLANEFDPNALRTRSAALLWDYGTRKQDANAQSDVKAPLSLLGGLLNFGGITISPSTLSGIRQSSLCGNG